MLSNIKQQEINIKNPLDTLPVALIIHDIKTIYYINNKASILLKQPVSEKEKKQQGTPHCPWKAQVSGRYWPDLSAQYRADKYISYLWLLMTKH